MYNLFFLIAGEIILLVLAYIIIDNDILAPSVLMCTMFVISTFVAILNMENWAIDDEGYSIEAVLLMLTGILFFILGETAVRTLIKRSRKGSKRYYVTAPVKTELNSGLDVIDITAAKVFLVLVADLVICALYYYAIVRLVGPEYSGAEVFAANRRMGIARMAGEDLERVGGIISQLTNFVTVSGYIAGYILINNLITRDKNRIIQLGLSLIVVLSVLPGTMVAGRTQYLRIFISFVYYYYILWNQKYRWQKNLSGKIVRFGFLSLVIGIPAFYYSRSLLGRMGDSGSVFKHVSAYLGAGVFLFGKYVGDPLDRYLWGEESLVGVRKVLSFLGLGEASTSYNLEFRPIGTGDANVYTFFRRPLHDFGIGGMYIFTILVAVFFAYMYWGKIKQLKRTDAVNKWTLVYGYLIYWILISSILQYSESIISVGTLVKIILILLGYWFATKFHLKLRCEKFSIRI